jgi:hypothetical protein
MSNVLLKSPVRIRRVVLYLMGQVSQASQEQHKKNQCANILKPCIEGLHFSSQFKESDHRTIR